MNFFKSMLSDDSEPEGMNNNNRNHQQSEKSGSEYIDVSSGGGLWSLVKTITTRSESVLETYRRDLKEFGSGLRKESDLFREVANRAVKDLPSSIDGVLKSTVEIISQDDVLEPSDESINKESVQSSRMYNRFSSQLNAMQTDARTYCEEPEDLLEDYNKWKLGFVLSDRGREIEELIGGNGRVEEIYKKLVPSEVDDVSFWCRYFYRVYKLKQQEEMRVHLVRRSLTVDDEEELSWDVDDDDDDEEEEVETRLPEIEKKQNSNDRMTNDIENDVQKIGQKHEYGENGGEDCLDVKNSVEEVKLSGGGASDHERVGLVGKTDENIDCSESCGKDVEADEDLEWDEIGDIGDDDEKHVVRGETAKKGEFLKRVNIAEDDEDLTWDIEDDDEPMKSLM